MARRVGRALALGAAFGFVACGGPRPPDVLLIVLDTMRADALSAYGNPHLTSPHLDAFAREAALFENAVTTAASTAPALAALMSGRLPHYDERLVWNRRVAHGMGRFFPGGQGSGLAPELETLAERFRDAGYRTAGFVTNPYVKRIYHFDQGFDRYDEIFLDGPVRYGLAEHVVDGALAALQDDGGPVFLYLHFMDAHDPYLPPAEHRDAFSFASVPGMDDMALNRAWFDEAEPEGERGLAMARHARGLYDASVRYLDAELGRLLDALAQRPEAIVAIVGDHGEEFLEHGGNRHRGTLYEELLRVPVLLRIPGVPAGRIDALVRHFDVGATLLDYAGLAPLPEAEAVSLRPYLEGAVAPPDLAAVGSFPVMRGPFRPRRWFVRDAHHKLIFVPDAPGASVLYDLQVDPAERRDLYAEAPERVAELRERLDPVVARLEAESAAALSGRVRRLRIEGGLGLDALGLVPGTRLWVRPDSGELIPETEAPAGLYVPLMLFDAPAHVEVSLDVEVAEPTTLRVLWLEPGGLDWSSERSAAHRFAAGRSRATLEVEAPAIVAGMRLEVDSGSAAIHAIEVADLSAREDEGGAAALPVPIDAQTVDQLRALGYAE